MLMFFGAVAEMATLGAVVPFLAILADPSMTNKYHLLQTVFSWFSLSNDEFLLSAGVMFGVIAVCAALTRILLTWCSSRFSYGLGADIGGEVYRRCLFQPYNWHVSRNSSEIIASIEKVNAVVSGVLMPMLQTMISLVISVGILAMLMAIDTSTALIACLGFCVLYGITMLTLRRQIMQNGKIIAANVKYRIQAVQEGLGGIRDVLLDGTQNVHHRKFAIFDYKLRRAQSFNIVSSTSPRYIIEAFGMVLIVAIAYWLNPSQGGLTSAIPVLGALVIGAQKLLPQMQLIYQSWTSINGNRKNFEDVLNLLELPIASEYTQNSSEIVPIHLISGTKQNRVHTVQKISEKTIIDLQNVSFRYKPESNEVLKSIHLNITHGARIGFIGKTGSGKSTLVDIIMGLLEPSSGKVIINGHPLTSKNRLAWQNRIAHVPQAIYLSDTNIGENIAFGVPKTKIDPARVKAAATKAQLSEFIESLPAQYQTYVGERGVRLSGGQRQRIGLARALYKQADVLILDEATSALDEVTENSVMNAIKSLGNELTVLMIAHRLTTLRECDKIIELDNGSVVRVGRYTGLIEP